ncbi:erythromycin esterase family protein [Phytoactinopolyspora limicola]|uniref:erythromycin esterase family protein n=1 Tax=Phytoactinopolyspora limicola TaxID=2715536 RepID=UPI001FE5BD44|nr:erythromycin esterase family protein [Phytoactinopolyspora limicola]
MNMAIPRRLTSLYPPSSSPIRSITVGLITVVLVAVGLVATVSPATAGSTQGDDVIAELDDHAHPLRSTEAPGSLRDLRPLGDMIGDADVVGLGEATHGTREFFTMKHRVFRYLVEEEGFRAFSQEVHPSAGLRINDYVLHGTGNIRQIMREEFQGGTQLWNTKEYLDLFEWMRAYNKRHPDDPVQYSGNDIDYAGPELFDRVTEFVREQHPEQLSTITDLYHGLRPATTMATWLDAYPGLPLAEREANAERAERALNLLREQDGPDSAERAVAIQHATEITQVATIYAFDLDDEAEAIKAVLHRENAMAENVVWWREHTGDRILLSAHNGHVAYESARAELLPVVQGGILRDLLGDAYTTIGFTFAQGAFNAENAEAEEGEDVWQEFSVGPAEEGSNEHALSQVRYKNYLLDTRTVPATAHGWLSEPRPTYYIGGLYPMPNPADEIALADFFDIVIHLDSVRASRMLPSPPTAPASSSP